MVFYLLTDDPGSYSTILTLSPCTGLISTVVNHWESVKSRLVVAGCVDFGVMVN